MHAGCDTREPHLPFLPSPPKCEQRFRGIVTRVSCDTRELGLLGPLSSKQRVMMRAMFDTRELQYTRATIARPPSPPICEQKYVRALARAIRDTRKLLLPSPPGPHLRAMMRASYDVRGPRYARDMVACVKMILEKMILQNVLIGKARSFSPLMGSGLKSGFPEQSRYFCVGN